jgi:hypothetical protein
MSAIFPLGMMSLGVQATIETTDIRSIYNVLFITLVLGTAKLIFIRIFANHN